MSLRKILDERSAAARGRQGRDGRLNLAHPRRNRPAAPASNALASIRTCSGVPAGLSDAEIRGVCGNRVWAFSLERRKIRGWARDSRRRGVRRVRFFCPRGFFNGFPPTARGHCPRANLARDTSRDMEAQISAASAFTLVSGGKTAVAPFLRCASRPDPSLGRRLSFFPSPSFVTRPRAPRAGGVDRPTRGASASKPANAFARALVRRAKGGIPRRSLPPPPAPLPPRDTPRSARC
jgi:hypothetical protein